MGISEDFNLIVSKAFIVQMPIILKLTTMDSNPMFGILSF